MQDDKQSIIKTILNLANTPYNKDALAMFNLKQLQRLHKILKANIPMQWHLSLLDMPENVFQSTYLTWINKHRKDEYKDIVHKEKGNFSFAKFIFILLGIFVVTMITSYIYMDMRY